MSFTYVEAGALWAASLVVSNLVIQASILVYREAKKIQNSRKNLTLSETTQEIEDYMNKLQEDAEAIKATTDSDINHVSIRELREVEMRIRKFHDKYVKQSN